MYLVLVTGLHPAVIIGEVGLQSDPQITGGGRL